MDRNTFGYRPKLPSKNQGTSRPTMGVSKVQQKQQRQPVMSDEFLLIRIQDLTELKFNIKELSSPKDSPHLFAKGGVFASLITNATTVNPFDNARITNIAVKYFRHDTRLHPKFATVTSLAASIQYFISLFHPSAQETYFTMNDIFRPDSKRVRVVLSELVSIASFVTKYETELGVEYGKIKWIQDRSSDLWERENHIRIAEEEQQALEQRQGTLCHQAKEHLRMLSEKLHDTKDEDSQELAAKTTRQTKICREKLEQSKATKERLSAKLTALQEKIVSDPQQIIKRVEVAKEENRLCQQRTTEKHTELANQIKRNQQFEDCLGYADDIYERFMICKRNDYVDFLKSEKEMKMQRRGLKKLKDEFEKQKESLEKSAQTTKELRARLEKKKTDAAASRSNQGRVQKELERELKGLHSQIKESEAQKAKLQEQLTGLSAAVKETKQQYLSIEQQNLLAVADMKTEYQALVTRVRVAKQAAAEEAALLKAYFEEKNGREVSEPAKSRASCLPITARTVYHDSRRFWEREQSLVGVVVPNLSAELNSDASSEVRGC